MDLFAKMSVLVLNVPVLLTLVMLKIYKGTSNYVYKKWIVVFGILAYLAPPQKKAGFWGTVTIKF